MSPCDYFVILHAFALVLRLNDQWHATLVWLQLRTSMAIESNDIVPKTGPNGEELIMPGMEFMMECYEDELKRPIRNLVSGQLARSLLIQVLYRLVCTAS